MGTDLWLAAEARHGSGRSVEAAIGEVEVSRSGYSDNYDNRDLAMWRGQVASAIRGKRGQAFLHELADALDAMPEKRLIKGYLQCDAPAFVPPQFSNPQVCALGSVGVQRGVDLTSLDPYDYDTLARLFGIAHQLVQEIEYENDAGSWSQESPEMRWGRMREWVRRNLKAPSSLSAGPGGSG